MVRVIRSCKRSTFHLMVGILALVTSAVVMAQGPGDLLVAPTRVVLTDRQRTGELMLMNAGTTTATYRITFTHLRMSEVGGMQEISAPTADEPSELALELAGEHRRRYEEIHARRMREEPL